MKDESQVTTVQVRCSGALHRITLDQNGRLALHDHKKSDHEHAFAALGGQPCRCIEVRQAWQRGNRAKLPQKLRKKMDDAILIKQSRMDSNNGDPLDMPIIYRLNLRIKAAVHQLLNSCGYRKTQSTWAGGNHYVSVAIGDPDISGESDIVWSSNGKWSGTNSTFSVQVPARWYTKVYKRGIGVVDGIFVLELIQVLSPDKLVVLAGKQGRGFSINPCRAVITYDGNNWNLKWQKGRN